VQIGKGFDCTCGMTSGRTAGPPPAWRSAGGRSRWRTSSREQPGAGTEHPWLPQDEHLVGGLRLFLGDDGAADGHDEGDNAVDALGGLVLGGLDVAGDRPGLPRHSRLQLHCLKTEPTIFHMKMRRNLASLLGRFHCSHQNTRVSELACRTRVCLLQTPHLGALLLTRETRDGDAGQQGRRNR
jgi:hypothetical protein